MKKHQFGFYLLLCSLVLSACQLAAPTKVDLPRSRPIASSQPIQEAQQALKDKIKNKPVYNGPIRIGLLHWLVASDSEPRAWAFIQRFDTGFRERGISSTGTA